RREREPVRCVGCRAPSQRVHGHEPRSPVMKRTSTSHPIDVMWVDPAAHGGSGRLGLTYAPGKRGRAPASGIDWDRDMQADLERLRDAHHADVLVSLMEPFEYEELRIPTLFDEARSRGIEVAHLPLIDGRAPAQE